MERASEAERELTYRKTALVKAAQFLPAEGKFPRGVQSDELADPRKSTAQWVLKTLEGRHVLRNGDYVCTGPAGEQWNVSKEIFEATYELAHSRKAAPIIPDWNDLTNEQRGDICDRAEYWDCEECSPVARDAAHGMFLVIREILGGGLEPPANTGKGES
jgi:hypothetical protein